jgi:1-acyl-sn-glycerol-3-phosphate acyltransferase
MREEKWGLAPPAQHSSTFSKASRNAKDGRPHFSARPYLLLLAGSLLLTVWAAVMLIVAVCTGFRMRRFYSEVMGRWLGNAALTLCGVGLKRHGPVPVSNRPVVFVANHTSTLDLFILLALGLPRTRFFLKRKYRLVPPLGVIGYLVGVFFTPPQTNRANRVRCFQHAESVLRKTGDSVFLSPEGTRITSGEIGPFNKGAVHLATNLKAPIVPIFISIPKNINPGRGFAALPGEVHVSFQAAIPTADWKLSDLEKNKNMVRDRFVALNDSPGRQ